jgi:hypothetical protein
LLQTTSNLQGLAQGAASQAPPGNMVNKNNMLRKEDIAGAYAEATDSARQLLRVQTDDRQEHRIKPDLETHPEAEFECKEVLLSFSLFDLIPLPPLRKKEHPGIELLNEASLAKLV